ncbi:zf-HC2 domain-containing protein [Candidatus Viridilinea mediisalina]|uniref:Uncharacterized protein n=1 Tax=Candidatus Viridilinea mediisalina TaxID=2024553 RepID=A0A2A6RLI5_9CHLR|nr:zf-HC2 domain-containing protein [Candidatus Viridilinea mediisalina]PDW03718.1 hypothetical protein CJ255_07370 [Candidatus Viridilinea mediisalina]
MTTTLPPLEPVIACCQAERSAFRQTGERHSPCCVQVFRRAFAGDQQAWMAIDTIFHPMINKWVLDALSATGNPNLLDAETLQDVIQEAKSILGRVGPQRPDLFIGDELGRLLKFWATCTKRAVLIQLRWQRRHIDDDIPLEPYHALPPSDADLAISLQTLLATILITAEERLVFELLMVQGYKPAEIAARFPERFADVGRVYALAQRIRRRCWANPELRQLAGIRGDAPAGTDSANLAAIDQNSSNPSAAASSSRKKVRGPTSLEMRINSSSKEGSAMNIPCELDEASLFDYVTGFAPVEVRAAVEANLACLVRAQTIAAEVAQVEELFYRYGCPAPEQLVAYQEDQLEGTARLVFKRHLATCAHCQAELALLAHFDAVPLDQPGPLAQVRQVVEAILQPALTLQLRGQAQIYSTPQVLITLSLRHMARSSPRWTLTGELSAPDGSPFMGTIEEVRLAATAGPDQPAELDEDGTFTLRNLAAGRYQLIIVTTDLELLIKALIIGEVDAD